MSALMTFLALLAAVAVSAAVSFPLRRGAEKCAEGVGGEEVPAEMASVRAAVGKGALFAVLGGYRSLVADFLWIKGYVNWEDKDIAKCVSAMELACEIDPSTTVFWTQASSVIAFDIPHWIFERMPKNMKSDAVLDSLKIRQARKATEFIDRALALYPDNYELLIQKGQTAIAARLFGVAEDCFGRAAKLDNGFYARRIYASLLERNGKFAEARKVLEKLLEEVEPDNPSKALIADQLKSVVRAQKNTQ